MRLASAATTSSAAALVFLAGVHFNWARGSSWPAKTRTELADAVIGGDRLPGPIPTVVVALLLLLAAASVAGYPARGSRLRRGAAAVVTAALALRGLLGFTVVLPQMSETFRRWDRRCYAPLCLVLAVLASPSIAGESDAR